MSEFKCPKCGAVLTVAAKPEQPKGTITIQDAKNLFPSELEQLLIFEEKPDTIIVRPKRFLGSEDFAKIAAIVRANRGEYISAGKNSHFRIPKN